MYPRKQFDIAWSDLIAGAWYAINPFGNTLLNVQAWACFSVRTGFDALLTVLDFPQESEIIMPGMTIPDMLTIVREHGLVPVGCDIAFDTLAPKIQDLENCVTQKTKAIVVTHLFGCKNDLKKIAGWARAHNLLVIEDSAQAFTGLHELNNEHADVSMFSFGPLKTATALGGALMAFRDTDLAQGWNVVLKSYPRQRSLSYLRTIMKYSILKLLSWPFLYGGLYALCKAISKDFDSLVGSSTRAFRQQDLMQQIHKQPSPALLKLMRRRFQTYDIDRFRRQQAVGSWHDHHFKDGALPGIAATIRTYWLYPVLVPNPKEYTATMREKGIDAAQGGTTSLTPVPGAQGIESLCFLPCYPECSPPSLLVTDQHFVRLWHARAISAPESEREIKQTVDETREGGGTIALYGAGQSQGGQQFYSSAHLIDMRKYRGIIHFDAKNKTITVRSGTTWDEIQRVIHPTGCAVAAMQSSAEFTVGGSISANIHGRQLGTTTIGTTVLSMRVLLADSSIKIVSRTENQDLFHAIIGGYGLIGIILEATLRLMENEMLEQTTIVLPIESLVSYFQSTVTSNHASRMLMARLSIAPDHLFNEAVAIVLKKTHIQAPEKLTEERFVARDRLGLALSRHWPSMKKIRWALEKRLLYHSGKTLYITTNNAKRPPATPLKFLDRYSQTDTDYAQEYFIPQARFLDFIYSARAILASYHANVLGATVRWIGHDTETTLSYARQDCFSFMLYCNRGRDTASYAQTHAMVRELINFAIHCGGAFYLAYELYASREQFELCYPQAQEFFSLKQKYDPGDLFRNSLCKYRDRDDNR